jgi:N-acetylneuraminic acid mutarotase
MPTARIGVTGIGSNGTIYALGGSTTNSVVTVTGANEAYSTEDDTWVSLAPMPTPRRYAMAAVDLHGRIYVIGGGSPMFTPPFTNIVERYLPESDTWESLASMPSNRVNAAVTTGLDGLIYVMGGFNGNQTTVVEVFDPESNRWSTRAPLLVAAGGPGGATGPDGTIYVIGGANFVQGTLNLVQAYASSSDSWSLKSNVPTARFEGAVATGEDDLVYFIGGHDFPSPVVYDVVESYDPLADSWATAPSLLTKRNGLGAAAGEDGIICAFGGIDDKDQILNSAECFCPRGHHHHCGHRSDEFTTIDFPGASLSLELGGSQYK